MKFASTNIFCALFLWRISAVFPSVTAKVQWCLSKWRYHDESSTFSDTRRNQFRPESTYLTQPCHRLLFREPQRKRTSDIGPCLHTLFLLRIIFPLLLRYTTCRKCVCSKKVPFWRDVEDTLRFSLGAQPIQIKSNKKVE